MDYGRISEFLNKFKNLLHESEESTKIIKDIVTKHISSPIELDMIKVKNKIIYIKGSPLFKSEIYIHKKGILEDLQALLPHRFNDIR